MRQVRAYRAYMRASVRMALQYRVVIFAFAFVTLLWIVLLTRLWTAAYQDRPAVAGFTLDQMVVYLTLSSLQAMIIISPLAHIIAGRVRSGEVVFDVSRPLSYPGQMLALQAGQTLTQTSIVLLVAPLAALLGGLAAPASAAAGLLYPVAVLFGWLLNALLTFLIGLSAFWTVDNMGLSTLFRFIAAFLAGASVPLTLMPGPLRALAGALPFRFIAYQPAAIYVGQVHGREMIQGFALAAGWVVVLVALTGLIWRRAYRKTMVHGG
ncbi:ABC transporter permease [Paractinoplanes rishiriensis]|uniref:ABC transporter permease n=1 Tax=Paractinoplanes rishiriensis TaxID=1050105 RepID=A0A919MTK1_9ACTN|nr:ABC-2 family transporter protein [Actinoplanes rishiriensis]GIE94344.1 ABC transporter permease [Actinoplanes rishiriensis]